MKNVINYYYNLNPDKINQLFSSYYFYIAGDLYYFVPFDKDVKYVRAIYEFNQELVKRDVLVNVIVNNQAGTILTYVHQKPFLLMRVMVNMNKPICLSEIHYLASLRVSYDAILSRSNWANLWADKIDYLEYHHEQNYQKYPILNKSFAYFVGLSENAISYLNEVTVRFQPEKVDIGVIAHDIFTLEDTVYSLYNPLNIIIDHKARDVSEYIKFSFFQDNYRIFDELDEYFKYNYFSVYGIHLILARVLYPSFYFELYEEIINQKLNESVVLKITNRISEYEKYLRDVFGYFSKYYSVMEVGWLQKRHI